MERALQKSIIATKEFLNVYFERKTTPVTSSNNEILEPSPSSTVSINPTNPKLKVMPSETVKREPLKYQEKIEKENAPPPPKCLNPLQVRYV